MSGLSGTHRSRRAFYDDPSNNRHGTYNGYKGWACRCDRCTRANADYCARMRANRLTKPVPRDVHGTLGGTANWSCDCGVCLEAKRDYDQRRKTA